MSINFKHNYIRVRCLLIVAFPVFAAKVKTETLYFILAIKTDLKALDQIPDTATNLRLASFIPRKINASVPFSAIFWMKRAVKKTSWYFATWKLFGNIFGAAIPMHWSPENICRLIWNKKHFKLNHLLYHPWNKDPQDSVDKVTLIVNIGYKNFYT